MNCTKSEQENMLTLSVSGDLLISDVGELRESILPCLAASEFVQMDLQDIGEIDTAGIQLLLAAVRSVTAAGNRISLQSVPPAVLATAEKLGICPDDFSIAVSGGRPCPE